MMSKTAAGVAVLLAVTKPAFAAGAAGSEYLGNNQRAGYVDAEPPAAPVLLWTYQEQHPPRHAWREPNREIQYVDFDYATQTAIGHGMVYFGSSADHKVYALDLHSGEEQWTFYTEGPVRFAPVVHQDRLYVVSDDGRLYCLNAATGQLVWKFRGGPADEKLIGNDQMISHWPCRSGVLIEQGRLFFTAGMWSRDGVFIYCLDPEDGSVVWKNDTSGFHFMSMPHYSGFGGVAPQGPLVYHRNMLYVPTGRGAPAGFDAQTGRFLWYENGLGYKPHYPGGSWVMAYKDWIVFKRRHVHGEEDVRYEERDPGPGIASGLIALDWRTGEPQWSLTDKNLAVACGDAMILAGAGPVIKVDINDLMAAYSQYFKGGKPIGFDENLVKPDLPYVSSAWLDRARALTSQAPNPAWMSPLPFAQWSTDVGRVYVMLQVGSSVLAGGRGKVTMLDAPTGRILWRKDIEGDARGICSLDGKFVVSSTAGKLYCFGQGDADTGKVIQHARKRPQLEPETGRLAQSILDRTGITAGYCLMLGAGDGQLIPALADRSELVVYCLEPDAQKASRLRKMLDDAGLLGVRAQIHHGALDGGLPYNPYVANLILWGDKLGSGIGKLDAKELYRVLRPYGGVACQLASTDTPSPTRQWLSAGGVPEDEVSESPSGLTITRGELPGAGEWTHPHADVGRTRSSEDRLVKLPLGMLWWGGPGPARIVSRHWRAPVPLFSNGILFIQGQHDVIAVDAYNGREMWNRHIENVGRFPPFQRGGNIVADQDAVYCIQGNTCLRLDARTGETVRRYEFPVTEEHMRQMRRLVADTPRRTRAGRIVWEYLGLSGKYILGTLADETMLQPANPQDKEHVAREPSPYIFAFDKNEGKLVWEHLVERSVSHTAIVADHTRVYFLDRTRDSLSAKLQRRGAAADQTVESSLKALDLATGELVWQRKGIPPQCESLLLKNGVIVARPAPAEWQPKERNSVVAAYSSRNGAPLWQRDSVEGTIYMSRNTMVSDTAIVGDTLYTPRAFNLHTGEELLPRKDPLTGQRESFKVNGKSFCGTMAAGQNLLTFRSACIGLKEISRDSGAFWFPETRPSCWISVIPAGGILLAPEGYSTCVCPYNYKTSLAMAPVQRNEDWSIYLAGPTYGRKKQRAEKSPAAERVKTLRANFNAPGDRLDSEGNLWMSYPRPAESRRYDIKTLPIERTGDAETFRYNSDYYTIDGTRRPWLYTSGFQGALKFDVQLSHDENHEYTVRFHFAETEKVQPQGRVFDVKVQGKTVVPRLDIVAETGGRNRALVKEVKGIPAMGTMAIELTPVQGLAPSICAMEIVEHESNGSE